MKELAYYDGQIGSPDQVMIPFGDRVHFFGDGVYEATLSGNHKIFLLEEHLDRFYSSAKALEIRIPIGKGELGQLLTDLLQKVEGRTHFVYWQVTRGVAQRNHTYDDDLTGKLWVSIRPFAMQDPEKEIGVITKEDTRFYHCNIKTLNLLPSVMASQDAKRAGAGETVFHRGETVTECSHSNVSILKDGMFISHPNDNMILRGIAKTHMIMACYRLGIQVVERPFTLAELMDADEILITSSSNFYRYATKVDGHPVGGKDPENRKLLQNEVIDEFLEYTGLDRLME